MYPSIGSRGTNNFKKFTRVGTNLLRQPRVPPYLGERKKEEQREEKQNGERPITRKGRHNEGPKEEKGIAKRKRRHHMRPQQGVTRPPKDKDQRATSSLKSSNCS
jgi:hypothetical protein